MRAWASRRFGGRFWALALKELRQIRGDRRLAMSLVVPPILQILLFGFALDSHVRDLRLGVVDESRTRESRDLVSAITENQTFRLTGSFHTAEEIGTALAAGRLDVGLVIPYDYARERARGRPVTVQVLLNAANANTAQIAQGYIEGAVAWVNQHADRAPAAAVQTSVEMGDPGEPVRPPAPPRARVEIRPTFLYNPGLVNTWFIVTGIFGTLIILNGSLVSGATMIREKERGTVEQLLMTPASALEVIMAKILPLFVLLMGMVGLVLAVARLVFHVPFRGSLLLMLVACACCVLTGIGIGTFLSTFARSANQTQLIGFFVNPPLAMLSGALTPIEAMPRWIQPVTRLNPIAYFASVARAVLVKGAGLDVVYLQLVALAVLAFGLVAVSAWRFRRQHS